MLKKSGEIRTRGARGDQAKLKRLGAGLLTLEKQQFRMSNLTCPKCAGTDYFMSNRNVIKGIGGIWGNRGGVKQFPVCKVCDEIMSKQKPPRGRLDKIDFAQIVLFLILFFVGNSQIFGAWVSILFLANILFFIVRLILQKVGPRAT